MSLDEDYTDRIVENKTFAKEFYKYWFSFKGRGGFLSMSPWLATNKISIDIGETKESGGKSTSGGNTKLWTNTLDLYAYLTAITNNTAAELYPAKGRDPAESYIYYGGGSMDGKLVSRILKIHYWQDKNQNYIEDAFAWKAAHFEGTQGPTGAIQPNMQNQLSGNMIKIPRLEMHKMQQRLHFTLQAYANEKGVGRDNPWWNWQEKE